MNNTDMHEKVSIVIPCYNGERLMCNSLDSILQQTYRNVQVIFINDGSTDATEVIAKEYQQKFSDAGMEFLYFYKENGGAASAVNVGLKHYNGDYFMWLDSDDILVPDCVETGVAFLRDNPKCDYGIGSAAVVMEGAYDRYLLELKRTPPEKENRAIMLHDLIFGVNTIFGPGAVICRTELIQKAIPKTGIYESREGQNWQLLIPITYYGARGYISKVMFKCVEHADSHSRNRRSTESMIEREMELIRVCTATIDQIPEMLPAEKDRYKTAIEIMHVRNIHRICLRHGRLRQGYQSAAKLRQLGDSAWRYRSLLAGYISYALEKLNRK